MKGELEYGQKNDLGEAQLSAVGLIVHLTQSQYLIRLHICSCLHLSRRPANLELIDRLGAAEAKVQSRVARREIGSAAVPSSDLRFTAGLDTSSGSDGVFVGTGADELDN